MDESGSKNIEINTGDLGENKEVELDRTGVNEVNEEDDNNLETAGNDNDDYDEFDESGDDEEGSGQVDSFGSDI